MTARTIAIVGASLAGAKAAEAIRAEGFDGRVVLIGDEAVAPYERPALSKEVLRGTEDPEAIRVHADGFYADNAIELVHDVAVRLDLAARRVELAGGREVDFDAAILATGSSPRPLDVPGATLAGVHYLRTIDDAARLREAIRASRRVAVIGAGWIGCEVAASARDMGAAVVLVDPAAAPLQRALGRRVGAIFGRLHTEHGVETRFGVGARELRGRGHVERVVLSDGRVEEADVVVVGIGITPRLDLAETAVGLRVADGVVVDEFLQSSVAGVFAAGDVASAWHPLYGRYLRTEHWANALNQGTTAGRNARGAQEAYTRLPYFFSDQYDCGLEYVGWHESGDSVAIRGDVDARKIIAFWHRDGVVRAAMTLNVWDALEDLKAVVASRRRIRPERLADPDEPLAQLLT